ncbi:choice-of-anchor D domain-containing protein [Streptomyces sp. BK205]|uniref:choice-of-anchor D domain-containing protein n=1 Tax=Streptomyces sp. BK205 TaxID=2512164 RepID=UPI001043DFD6|nr:choice-of-anchor D domain-containing protein [Streptomyces sp. BK205]TCR15956.1 ASPM-SPD-2-Hydin domain-containing protein [Streptomyces sp. BK205]
MTQHAAIEIAIRAHLHEARRLARARADGEFDREAWLEALQQVESLERDGMQLRIAGFGGGVAGSAPLAAAQWRQVGPAPMRQTLGGGPAPVAGRVYDVAVDPRGSSDKTLYAATLGGIWKSLDSGATWAPKTDRLPWTQMSAVALDPANPDIVYAGGIFTPGPSLFRSVDGGETWSTIGGAAMLGQSVVRLVLPAPGVVLVGTFINGVYRSVNDGANFGNNLGAYDNNAPILGGSLTDLHLHTTKPTTVYACMRGKGIFESTDSGATFPTNLFANPGAPAAGTYETVTMAQSTKPADHTMYATASTQSAWVGLFKSTNDGKNWKLKPAAAAAAATGAQFGFDQTIGVDPQDARRVYLGFLELHLSTDGGESFDPGSLTGGKVHVDHHAITFSPQPHWGAAPTRLYVGTDGGTAVSGDGGSTWTNLNEGVSTILVGMGSLDIGRHSADNNGYSYAGSQDNGTAQRAPGMPGNDWSHRLPGDGGWVAVDPFAPLSVHATVNNYYQHSTDGGATWTSAAGITPRVDAIAVDPDNGSRVYAAGGPPGDRGPQLLRSTDHGASFTSIHTFPEGILSIAPVDGSGGASVWVGLTDGSMWRTDNALMGTGSTWNSYSTGLPGRGVTSIAVDPFSPQRVMAGYWGASGIAPPNRSQHVYLTTNNGLTWADASGTDGSPTTNLPDLPVYSVAMDPGSSNGLSGITTSGSLIVAVGLFGTVLTSTDGITWTARVSDAYNTLADVVWTGSQFVAVGLGGAILSSADGIVWTTRKAGPSWEALQGVAWSGAVLVVTSASYGMVYRSTDGTNWISVNDAAPQALLAITWGNGQFVAVGYSGTVVTSPDGLTWTAHTTPTTVNLVSVVWSGTQFVATGTGTILTSPDGSTWTARVSPTSDQITGVAWSGVRFVGSVNSGEVVTSPDGVTWALQPTGSAYRLSAILWTGSQFIAVGDFGTVLTSADGTAWADHSVPAVPPALICGNETGVLFSIDDGATWRVLGVGLPTASCTSLALDWSRTPSLLRVGTNGRSVFELVTTVGPRVAVVSNLAFGKVALNSSANLVAKVFNAGSTPLSVTGFARASGSSAFALAGGSLGFPFSLQPGQEQDITVRFQPTTAGIATAVFRLTSNDPGTPTVSVPMSGIGK